MGRLQSVISWVSCLIMAAAWPTLAQTPLGDEFQVNTYTTNNQWRVAVATSAMGDFIAAWSSTNQDGSSSGVFAQRYDSAGSPIGAEFQVNTTTGGSQSYPGVGMDTDGNFVVVWSTSDIFGQRFSNSGAPIGGEFTVNSYLPGSQIHPVIAMNPAREFVVAWPSNDQDGNSWGIFGQRFDADANPVGSEFQANTTTVGYQLYPGVAITESGEFVVVWNSTLSELYGQRFTSSGTATGAEFHVNTTTTGAQRDAEVGYNSTGEFVVVWRSYGQDGDRDAVIGQRFASGGALIGSEFQVNTYTTGSQSVPHLARAGDGDMTVIWSELSNDRDGHSSGTFGQLLDSSGSPVGNDFQVNTYTSGRQSFSTLAADDAGNFVVVWTSDPLSGTSQDGDQFGVFAQRFASPCSKSISLPSGQWKMLALPCDPGSANTVADVFGDDLDGTYGTDWIVFERDEAEGSYNALTLIDVLTPGVGYWIKTLNAGQTVSVGSNSLSAREVDLVGNPTGVQNLVGHPFDFDVCWADVRVIDGASVMTLDQADPIVDSMRACEMVPPDASCILSRTMHTWDGSYSPFDGNTPGAEGTLTTYDALWVKAFKAGLKLRIPARASASCGSSGLSPPSSPDSLTAPSGVRPRNPSSLDRPLVAPWSLRLIAEGGDLRDAGNLLGQLEASLDGRDIHDLKELEPFASPYLTVVFPQPEWGDQAGDYATDFHALKPRGRRDRWFFEVRASSDIEEVTLSWEGLPRRLRGKLRLVDPVSHHRQLMHPRGRYSFTMDGTPRVFEIRLRGRVP